MKLRHALLAFVAGSAFLAGTAYAAETVSIVAGATGRDLEVLQQELKDFDMTTTQMRALAVLSVSSSVTINELSVFSVTEQSTMSRTLDSLEEQGYIRRQARPDDMRVRDVSITAKGRAAFEKVRPMLYRMLLQMFDGVEEDEYRNFLGTLHKVLRNIRKHDI